MRAPEQIEKDHPETDLMTQAIIRGAEVYRVALPLMEAWDGLPRSVQVSICMEFAELRASTAAPQPDLAAENARLREALSPFAEYMHTPEGRMDLDNLDAEVADNLGVGWIYLTHGDFRRARAALYGPDRQREG